jgi:mono/diheme cytochrome c family protein
LPPWFEQEDFMRFAILAMGVLAGVCIAGAVAPRAQATEGRAYFERYCVTCHGNEGRGDGALAAGLKTRPADLTTLAAQNNGVFPEDRVRASIDGRERRNAPRHTDMPLWGDVLSKSADVGGADEVKARIEALVKYVERLQPMQSPGK